MGTSISTISRRITIEYIESAKVLLNHNKKFLPLIVDVDKISEFLNQETAWSTSRSLSIDELYRKFSGWLYRKYTIRNYNKSIFTEKLLTKRTVENNRVINIRFAYEDSLDCLRL